MKNWMWWLIGAVVVFAAWKMFFNGNGNGDEEARMAAARARARANG